MVMSFIASNWRVLAMAAMTLALGAVWHLYQGARDERDIIRAEYTAAARAAEAQRKEVEDRSTKTLEKINANHKTDLVAAVANAVANYAKRFNRPDHPRPVAGSAAARFVGGLRIPAGQRVGGDVADGACTPDATTANALVDPEFIAQCASTTLMVIEFQQWVMGNRLTVEGE